MRIWYKVSFYFSSVDKDGKNVEPPIDDNHAFLMWLGLRLREDDGALTHVRDISLEKA